MFSTGMGLDGVGGVDEGSMSSRERLVNGDAAMSLLERGFCCAVKRSVIVWGVCVLRFLSPVERDIWCSVNDEANAELGGVVQASRSG